MYICFITKVVMTRKFDRVDNLWNFINDFDSIVQESGSIRELKVKCLMVYRQFQCAYVQIYVYFFAVYFTIYFTIYFE